jgi:aspartyl-tRNA(Asn)/glutamyl-tRNA(Gln) amidotransferase subunit A
MTRTAHDAAIIFDAIAGYDPRDPASAQEPFAPTTPGIERPVSGLRLGVIGQYVENYAEPEVRRVAEAALAQLPHLGIELVPLEPDYVPLVGPVIMPLVQAEATTYHWQTLLDRPDDYSVNTRNNLRLGATVFAKDYLQAQRVRSQMQSEVDAALRTVDALIFPSAYDALGTAEADILDVEIGYTGLANLTGHPAISIPCGFTDDGLPVALQLTGRAFDEGTILSIAHAIQQATDWHTRRPDLKTRYLIPEVV